MTSPVPSHLNSGKPLPGVDLNSSTSRVETLSDKKTKKLANRIAQLFHFIWPLKVKNDSDPSQRRIISPSLENSQFSASVLADLAEVARDFEEMETLWKTNLPSPPPIRNPITKDTCLKKEQISIAEQTWIEGLYCRKEGEVFNQAFLVTDYTVLCFTVFYPEASVLNLGWCFHLTSLAMEYLARLSNLEVLDLSNCFPKGKAAFWRPASEGSLEWKASLLTPLAKCQHLHTLNLSHCSGLTDEDFQDLPSLTELRNLDLSYCSKLSAKTLGFVAQLPHLQKLQLVGCDQLRIAEKALLDLCTKCTLLEEVDLTDTGFYPEFASELVSKMPSVKKGVILGGEYSPINTFRRVENLSS